MYSDLWKWGINQNIQIMGYQMIYIGFSKRTHKVYAKIFCKNFRHVAPVIITKNKCVLYQFVNRNKIVLIPINPKDLNILKQYGWKFVRYGCKFNPEYAIKSKPINCVQFTKRACGIKKSNILTPYALFKYLNDSCLYGNK